MPAPVHRTYATLLAASCFASACRAHGRTAPADEIRYAMVATTPAERAAYVAALPRCTPVAPAQLFDGRLSELRRAFWVSGTHPHDTVFVATTDIPVRGDVQLGAGVIATTRARRESLLSSLASIHLHAP